MSLVNDMLRDLASQQRDEAQTKRNNDDWLTESSLVKKSQSNWLPSVLVFAVVLLGLLAVQKGWLNHAEEFSEVVVHTASVELQEHEQASAALPPTEPDSVETLKALPVAEASPADNLLESSPAEVAVVENVSEIEKVAEVDKAAEVAGRIYTLIQSAERAIALDRLTSPIEDNAYRYYQEVLQLSPQNAIAQEGLHTIAQRYLDLARQSLAQADRQRAEVLIERAAVVAPDYPAIILVRRQLEATPDNSTSANSAIANSAVVSSAIVNPQIRDLPLSPGNENEFSQGNSDSLPNSVAVASFNVAEANTDTSGIKPNAAWQDQQAATQAEQMLAQGQTRATQLFLQKFIAEHQQPVKAMQALFNLYLQESDQDAARFLLQQAKGYLPELVQTHLTAQLLLAQGNPAAAISTLEKNIQQAEEDEAYRALLAGLYHKTARYHESASHYRRLLDVFGEKPAYWLGLALALDALQQNASALEAFRRVGGGGSLPVQVKDYVEQRVLALSR